MGVDASEQTADDHRRRDHLAAPRRMVEWPSPEMRVHCTRIQAAPAGMAEDKASEGHALGGSNKSFLSPSQEWSCTISSKNLNEAAFENSACQPRVLEPSRGAKRHGPSHASPGEDLGKGSRRSRLRQPACSQLRPRPRLPDLSASSSCRRSWRSRAALAANYVSYVRFFPESLGRN